MKLARMASKLSGSIKEIVRPVVKKKLKMKSGKSKKKSARGKKDSKKKK